MCIYLVNAIHGNLMPGHFTCALGEHGWLSIFLSIGESRTELTSDAQFIFGDSRTNCGRVEIHGFLVASAEMCKTFGST